MTDFTPLERAIRFMPSGRASELARAIGVTPQAVGQWSRVPAERVLAVEDATGGRVTRYELRPDIYGPAPVEAEPAA